MKRPHTLIIDDDPMLRDFLAKIIRSFDIPEIRQTGSIYMASELLQKNAVDLVFLDIELGDENGLNALPDLQDLSPKTHFVIVSAHSSVDNAMAALADGAKGFLVKPFTPKKVKGILSKLKYLP